MLQNARGRPVTTEEEIERFEDLPSDALIPDEDDGPGGYLQRGTPAYRRANLALFAAGFSTFALMYCVQPLMPVFSENLGISPAAASLSLSVTTGVLAFAMLLAGSISEARGRKNLMTVSLLAAGVLTLLAAFAPNWGSFLVIRALEGLALSGVPAIAMAYLAEEVQPEGLGAAMGLYVGGTAFGGMAGRVLTGLMVDASGSWRVAIGGIGILGLIAALAFWRLLPPSRHFVAKRGRGLSPFVTSFAGLFRDAGLPWLFLSGFILMGAFVTVYNYTGYRLMAPEFGLGQAEVGAIFLIYLLGIPSSAWFGVLGGRIGRGPTLIAAVVLMLAGLGLTTAHGLVPVVLGIAVFTIGFFGGHSLASGWVGARGSASRAQASSLYLFSYYAGSSLIGAYGGTLWSADGWRGVATLVGIVLLVGFGGAIRLALLKREPPKFA
ncbi:MFS transporter, YNFM family, putative membrane transport protein [Faunimonas pinastri]|uniref:MFS transporter, YNFM family, putative membrane transport protein n=1 Tax=Faunimonas pinastri TaxID=1855383 RepID=A0A1H9NLK0_9HYPH|nr:MFS transporter [Faunimonas pinastri]SER36818.1 MFS transporter, YNFM family, putative membrane transport protein [Faunimonas pinastri]